MYNMELPQINEEVEFVREYLTSDLSRKELAEKHNMTYAGYRAKINRMKKFIPVEPKTREELEYLVEEYPETNRLAKVIKGGESRIGHYALVVGGGAELVKRLYQDELLTLSEIVHNEEVKQVPLLTEETIRNYTKQSKLTRNFKSGRDKDTFNRKLVAEQEATMTERYGYPNAMHVVSLANAHRNSRGIEEWKPTPFIKSYEEWLETKTNRLELDSIFKDYMQANGVDRLSSDDVSTILGISKTSLSGAGILAFNFDFITGSKRGEQLDVLSYIERITNSDVETEIKPEFMNGLELDIYIPEYNFAIEFNGSYWHSEAHKDKSYHQRKTDLCRCAGVTLMHIWEYDWNDPVKQDILKSQIAYKLHSDKVKHYYARKLTLKEVSSKDSRDFLDENHIQGAVNASVRYGLYDKDELIALMTFSKTQKARKEEWELKRFVTKKYTSVAGGASKLLKYFVKNNSGDLMSYANNDFAHNDAMYSKLGFEKVGHTQQGYKWVKSDSVLSRNKAQVSRLKAGKVSSEPYLENDTEGSYMRRLGYHKIYDAGNDIYTYKY